MNYDARVAFEPPDERTRPLAGASGTVATALATGLSLYSLYWVLFVVQPQIYRVSFLLIALVLAFLLYPRVRGSAAPVATLDWLLIIGAIACCGWPLVDFSSFIYRAATPSAIDVMLGAGAIVIVLEATRRTVGWILPITAAAFLFYALNGPAFDVLGLPWLAHRGYGVDRLVGNLYMTLEGLFGVPLDVAATYIILFTIYGAVLEATGAGRFFIDWSLAAMGRSSSSAAPGRAVTLAGFLLGSVSGSGVATTVMLGSVSWPLLKRSGFSAETGGAILSAAGIGALLSPPTLGAAAFLIAEYLRISYLQVLVMATIPTGLYYLSILLMIEADSRRMREGRLNLGEGRLAFDSAAVGAGFPGLSDVEGSRPESRTTWELTRRYGYHFTSLVAIAALMVAGLSAFRAVFWATVLAAALSFVRRETALTVPRLIDALRSGAVGVLPVVATTATAGIIVGVVTLTGLGLKIAGIIVGLANGQLFLTVFYSALAVWMLGLAVPVTASYILAAVMVAPALVQSGVPPVAAHMFIFYYAVLSEVSPPTALSPFAAAAITGGRPFRTMMLTWKYTLPAFLVPFVFTLSDEGMGLLLQADIAAIAWSTATAAVGIAAVAAGLGGWIVRPASIAERVVISAGGLCVFAANRALDGIGAALVLAAVLWHLRRGRR